MSGKSEEGSHYTSPGGWLVLFVLIALLIYFFGIRPASQDPADQGPDCSSQQYSYSTKC